MKPKWGSVTIDQAAAGAYLLIALCWKLIYLQPPVWPDLLTALFCYGLYTRRDWALILLIVFALLSLGLTILWIAHGIRIPAGTLLSFGTTIAFGVYSVYRLREIARDNKSKLPPPPPQLVASA
jgi:hypothetical protein